MTRPGCNTAHDRYSVVYHWFNRYGNYANRTGSLYCVDGALYSRENAHPLARLEDDGRQRTVIVNSVKGDRNNRRHTKIMVDCLVCYAQAYTTEPMSLDMEALKAAVESDEGWE